MKMDVSKEGSIFASNESDTSSDGSVSDQIGIDIGTVTVVCEKKKTRTKKVQNEPTYYEKISLGPNFEPIIKETICGTFTKYSYQSMNAFGCIISINAIGCILVANGILSILCINSIASFISINSIFSIFSVNCVFCIGCEESFMCVSSN